MTPPASFAKRLAVVALLFPVSLGAQDTRGELIAEAVQAYDNFETSRAMQLLSVALNPSIGAPDEEWANGVQLLTQVLIEEGNDSLANVWMRWAVRTDPDMEVDPVTYLPEVIQAYEAARRRIGAGSEGDVVTVTNWDWTQAGEADNGSLRVTSSGVEAPLTVTVDGASMAANDPLTLRPSTYRIAVAAEGYVGAEVEREIIPGVETILRFNLQPFGVADSVLYADAEASARRQLGQIWTERFGLEADCGAGFFAGANGLFLTTYAAIRGGENVEVVLSDGERISDGIQVASYDVGDNVAVLKLPVSRGDSLSVSTGPVEGQYVWGLGYPACGGSAEVSTLSVLRWPNRPVGNLQLSDSLGYGIQGGPLIDQRGTVVGLAAGGSSAIPADHTFTSLDEARRNIEQQQLMALRDVAAQENHLFGTVDLSAPSTGAMVRIQPIESWHWPELETTIQLPTTFAGPMGRYSAELLVNGLVADRTDFTIAPAIRDQLALAIQESVPAEPQVLESGGGGGFPWIIALLGVGAAGAAVAVLGGGGGNGTNPPPPPSNDPGSITVTIPIIP